MSILDIPLDGDIPDKRYTKNGGGGRGIGSPGAGPAGGFISFAGPGFAQGGGDFGEGGFAVNSRAMILRRMMAAIAAGQDNVPAMLQSGEFVMNRPATQANLPELQRMNAAGNDARGYALGGLVDAVSAPMQTSAGAAGGGGLMAGVSAAAPYAMGALEALKFINGLFGGHDGGPNGLERARSMGYGPEMPDQHFFWGGAVSPWPGAQGRSYAAPKQPAAPGVQLPTPTPAPTPQPVGTGSADPTNGDSPVTRYEKLLNQYQSAGAFGPNYGMSELQSALDRQNQGAQAADIRDLQASGFDDPSLYASALLASRSARSKDASATMANARLSQIQSAQDFARQLLSGRHSDQISELLARIK